MTIDTSERISLGESAYRQLRADIVSCRIAPGERLTEKRLSAETGFGVSPLRDALSRLEHDGLVQTLPRKYYQVTPISPKSVSDLFDAWALLGPDILRRGLTHASVEQRELLAAGGAAMHALANEERTVESALRIIEIADNNFAILAEATGSVYLQSFFRRIASDLARVWSLILTADPASLDVSAFWMHPSVDFENTDEAAKAAKAQIARVRRLVMKIVQNWPSVVDSEVVPLRPR